MSEASERDEAMLYSPGDRYADISAKYRRPWKFGPWSGKTWVQKTFRVYERSLAELSMVEARIDEVNANYHGAEQYVMVGMVLVGPEAVHQTLATLQAIVKAHYELNYPSPKATAVVTATGATPSLSVESFGDSAPPPSAGPPAEPSPLSH